MKIPPYGKALLTHYPYAGIVYLFIGKHSWRKGKLRAKINSNNVLILPPDVDPSSYHWPIKDCIVIIIETSLCDTDYIKKLVCCLYVADAFYVSFVSVTKTITHFEKEF